MGVIRVTRRPYYYAQLEEEQKRMPPPDPVEEPSGTLSFRFMVGGLDNVLPCQQRTLRDIVSSVFKEKGRFMREASGFDKWTYYQWEKVDVCGNCISAGRFELFEIKPVLELMKALDERGLFPYESIVIKYYPENPDMKLLFNLVTILESRRPLIEEALSLEEPFAFNIFYGLGLSISLSSFSYTVVEAAAYLLEQACKMAETTGKSRMKPCDMTNPKFQMRSWLLRLGFIGEQFERPRRTLMDGLSGDAAFFSEDQKHQAIARRKAKSMNGGGNSEFI